MKRLAAVVIAVIIAAIHVIRVGSFLDGSAKEIYYSYFSDFVIPFTLYFLLCAAELKIPELKSWKVKLALSILIPSAAETLQFFGLLALGSTFDPFDYLMYATGSCAAALIETRLFPIIFRTWDTES